MRKQGLESPQVQRVRWLLLAAAFTMCLALAGGAQFSPGSPKNPYQQPIGQRIGGIMDDVPNGGPIDNEKLLRALNADRQKSLISDTNKLLRLVNALNAEIARANPDSLSAGQLMKVAEIEKLARSVKDKMSTSVRGTPSFEQPHRPMR